MWKSQFISWKKKWLPFYQFIINLVPPPQVVGRSHQYSKSCRICFLVNVKAGVSTYFWLFVHSLLFDPKDMTLGEMGIQNDGNIYLEMQSTFIFSY